MNLLDLIKKHGRVELILADLEGEDNKVSLTALAGSEMAAFEVEQLYFATGGSITLVQDI